MIKIDQYYLDLQKVELLDPNRADIIHGYYKDMLFAFHDQRCEMAQSIAVTLIQAGYLLDFRDEKLNSLING